MEKGMHIDLMNETRVLIQNIPQEVLEQLSSVKKEVRERATSIILQPLEEKNPENANILQTIPICLTEMGDFDGALSFIAALISNGRYVSFEVIQAVYASTLRELAHPEVQGDREFITQINAKIQLLIDSTQEISDYNSDMNFLIFLGKEFERRGKYENAKMIYEKIVDHNHEEGWLHLALLSKETKDYTGAISFLQKGYSIFKTQIYLENIILVFSQIGEIEQAKKYYELLVSSFREAQPFIMYSLQIESDEDLSSLEEVLKTNIYDLHHILSKVTQNASKYIESNIFDIEEKLKQFIQKGVDILTIDECKTVTKLIERKLYLSYVDIQVLKNVKHLPLHLYDLNTLAFSGDEYKKMILSHFLEKYVSVDVSVEMNQGEESEDDEGEEETTLDEEVLLAMNPITNSVYFSLNVYLSEMMNTHFHGVNHLIIAHQLVPLLLACFHKLDMLDEEEHKCIQLKQLAYGEKDFLESLPEDIRNIYFQLVQEIDENYGTFFRVELSQVVRNPEISVYPKVLLEDPSLACFFFIEQAIAKKFIPNRNDTPEEFHTFIDGIIEQYKLGALDTDMAILFGEILLLEAGPDYAIHFLSHGYEVIENILGLYTILKSMQYLNDEEKKSILSELDELCCEYFVVDNFYDYTEEFLQSKIEQKKLTPFDKKYILLSLGILEGLKQAEQHEQKALGLFTEASQYASPEALLEGGNILEKNGQYEEALSYYEQALTLSPNINILSFILHLAISIGDFDTASKYITFGIEHKYQMGQYIFALLLRQGNIQASMKQYIDMKNAGLDMIDYPRGTLQLFEEQLEQVYSMEANNIDAYKQKVLFWYCIFIQDGDYEHIASLLDALFRVPDTYLNEVVYDTVSTIFGNSYTVLSQTPDEISMELVDKLGVLYTTYLREQFKALDENTPIQTKENIFHLINDITGFCISLLSRFPEHKGYTNKWKVSLHFPKYPGFIYADESLSSSPSLH